MSQSSPKIGMSLKPHLALAGIASQPDEMQSSPAVRHEGSLARYLTNSLPQTLSYKLAETKMTCVFHEARALASDFEPQGSTLAWLFSRKASVPPPEEVHYPGIL